MKDTENLINDNDQKNEVNGSTSKIRNTQDLGDFFMRFFKILVIHKWLFIAIFIIVALIVTLYALKQPKVYQSNYEVFYNENIREFVDDANVPVVKSDFDKNYWLRAMTSDEVMKIALKNSGLNYSPAAFKGMISVGLVDKRKEDRIPVFLVQISSTERDNIPVIIRAYIKALNELLIENQIQNSERLISYLIGQIKQNSLKLSQLDGEISDMGHANSEIVDFDKIKTSLDDFRKDLLNARVNLSSYVSARKRTENELRNLDGTIVNESAFSEPLKVQLMNLEVDLARALTKNKEDHPTVKQIRANIKQIGDMLRDSLEQRLEVKSLIQNPLKSQLMSKLLELQISEVSEETRVKSLEQVINELETKTMPTSVNQDQQQQLRNREMISLTIKQLNDKLIETQSASQGSLSRFVFIDDPGSIFLSNKGLIYYLILGLVLGFVLASLVVFLYDLLDDRIVLVEDYEHFYKQPLLGVLRHYKTDELQATKGSDYKKLSTGDIGGLIVSLRQLIKYKNVRTFVISSPDREDGKTLVSFKIASALAAKKQKVLLVDLDFFSPKLTKKIFPDMPTGLSDYIDAEESIGSIVRETGVEDLSFVAAGNAEGKKDLFYTDKKLAEFIEWAKANYDIVLFDTPAVMYIPDILELYDQIDGIIVVVRLRKTTRKLLDRLFGVLGSVKSKNISVILNDLRQGGGKSYTYSNYYYSDYEYVSAVNDENDAEMKRKFFRPQNLIIALIIAGLLAALVYWFNGNIFSENKPSPEKKTVVAQPVKSAPIVVDTVSQLADTVKITQKVTENEAPVVKQEEHKTNRFIAEVTIKRDSRLTLYALDYYGSKSFWVYIYLANKDVIANPDKLEVGTTIRIPAPEVYKIDANDPQAVDKARQLEKEIKSGKSIF